MGLSIVVGMLADLRENDREGYEHYKSELSVVSELLTKVGLPSHTEPETGECWSAEMFGYSGLHYLRRIAAHLELRGTLPPPGNKQAADDPVLKQYCDIATGTARGLSRLLRRAKPRKQTFDHLILHSDAEGYYVPIDFEDVLVDESHEVAGAMVGSSQRLLRECVRLRDALGIPEDLDPEADILREAAYRQGEGAGWQCYGIESLSCVHLLHGAKHSVEQGAALVFA